MSCNFVIRSPHTSPYMSSLMSWGFVYLLAEACPELLHRTVVKGRLVEYTISIDADNCEKIAKTIDERYNEVYKKLIYSMNNSSSAALEAWNKAYGPRYGRDYLQKQLPTSINVTTLLSEHHCVKGVKPHVVISGSIGKWMWTSTGVAQRDSIIACDTCRALAILGLEYASLVARGMIAVIGFDGRLEREDVFVLSSMLGKSTPWIADLKRALGKAINVLPEISVPLITSLYLPSDIPLDLSWYIVYANISGGRTTSFGVSPLNEYISFMNSIRMEYPEINILINLLLRAANIKELQSDITKILTLLSEAARSRNVGLSYSILRALVEFVDKARSRYSRELYSLKNTYDLAKTLISILQS